MKHFMIIFLIALGLQTSFAKENVKTFALQVTENGFEPSSIEVKPGTHVILKVTRKTDTTCATHIQIKEKNIKKDLPLNKEVTVDVGNLQKGEIRFACGMDMISGHIIAK